MRLRNARPLKRKLHHSEPEVLDSVYDLDKLLQSDRLRYPAVGAHLVTLLDIPGILRGSEHYNRNAFEVFIALDLLKHCAAIFFRHIQSEYYQVWPHSIGIRRFFLEILHSLHAIIDNINIYMHLGIFKT